MAPPNRNVGTHKNYAKRESKRKFVCDGKQTTSLKHKVANSYAFALKPCMHACDVAGSRTGWIYGYTECLLLCFVLPIINIMKASPNISGSDQSERDWVNGKKKFFNL